MYLGSLGSLSAWGACSISLLAGEAAVGGLLLAAGPLIGTFVLVVVGVAAVGTATYGAGVVAGKAWDSEIRKQASEDFTAFAKIYYNLISEAWKNREKWLLPYYGVDPNVK